MFCKNCRTRSIISAETSPAPVGAVLLFVFLPDILGSSASYALFG